MLTLGAVALGLTFGYAAIKASEWMARNFK
jgi:hypothetical protein